MSVAWIYVMADEIVAILRTMGVVTGISEAFLGMTILAWANSLGDLVANVFMARAGKGEMALSACLGAPVLSML